MPRAFFRFPKIGPGPGSRAVLVGTLAVLIVAILVGLVIDDRESRLEAARERVVADAEKAVARINAKLDRLDRMTQILAGDLAADRVLADPDRTDAFARAADGLLKVEDPPAPALLIDADGRVVLDRAGPERSALLAGLAPLADGTEPRFLIVTPEPAAGTTGSVWVVRSRPVPAPGGGSGLVAVALPAGILIRDALSAGPEMPQRIGFLTADGKEIDGSGAVRHHPAETLHPLAGAGAGHRPVAASDPEFGDTLSVAKPVADGSLQAVTTVSLAEVNRAWRKHAATLVVVALLLIALLITFLVVTNRLTRRRLEAERAYARQLERHAEATALLAVAPDVDALLRIATDWIRLIIPAHQSIASVTRNADFAQAVHAISFSERYAPWLGYDRPSDGSGIYRLVCRDNKPMRLTQAELVSHPAWRNFGVARDEHPPMRGWLAAPLISRDGVNLGILQLSDRESGDFSETDEALLVQIARFVSARLETLDARAAGVAAHEAETRARAEAEAAQAELARILSSISDGVCVVDRSWRVRYTNPHAARLIAGRLSQGADLWQAAPELAAPPVRERLVSAMADGRKVATGYSRSDGRVFDLRAFPFEDGLTVVLTDRTGQAEIEEQLRQTQKMEALGQITGGVAHDFNNLLTVILGNGDIIVETVGDNRVAATAARLMLAAAERASALTDRLLAFARRQPLDPRPVDVAALVAGIRDLLATTLGARIEVRIAAGPSPWQAVVDPGQLETTLLNLALNARDAMPEGGVLTIATRDLRVGPESADRHPGVAPGTYVLLSVSDTGVGMDREVLARAFEPFFTTKERGHGSGLGLSMIYGFLRQSGGHAAIESARGAGTTVNLYLPAGRDRPEAAPETAVDTPAPTGSERILLVEDDDLVREHLAGTLVALGYAVRAVADGAEAEAAFAEGPPVALLLTDIVLPGAVTGRILAERLRARAPGLAVLLMSGYAEDDILRREGARALGATDLGATLLQKPFRRQDIAVKVRAALDAATTSALPRASSPKSL